jgi:hypothetical protein
VIHWGPRAAGLDPAPSPKRRLEDTAIQQQAAERVQRSDAVVNGAASDGPVDLLGDLGPSCDDHTQQNQGE